MRCCEQLFSRGREKTYDRVTGIHASIGAFVWGICTHPRDGATRIDEERV